MFNHKIKSPYNRLRNGWYMVAFVLHLLFFCISVFIAFKVDQGNLTNSYNLTEITIDK